jgi:uncharacterized protein
MVLIGIQKLVKDALILFTKEPIIGQVKTRLIPCLGEQACYKLYIELVDTMLNRFANCCYASFIIYKTLSTIENSYFSKHTNIKVQRGEDLGLKMFHALNQELTSYNKVILFGADSPFLTEAIVKQAIISLDNYDYVFVPSTDGGYVLIGTKEANINVFQNINWSTSKVMLQTCQILDKMEMSYQLLEPIIDIDTADDLVYLKNTHINIESYKPNLK